MIQPQFAQAGASTSPRCATSPSSPPSPAPPPWPFPRFRPRPPRPGRRPRPLAVPVARVRAGVGRRAVRAALYAVEALDHALAHLGRQDPQLLHLVRREELRGEPAEQVVD